MIVYKHIQASASTTWTIDHNLDLTGVSVNVSVDVGGGAVELIFPESITKTANQMVIEFSSAYSGVAELRGTTGVVYDYTGFVQPVERAIDYTHSPL